MMALPSQAAETIRVDCAKVSGVIRPLHGVNGGPLVDSETTNLSRCWRQLKVPSTRLHDCEWPLPDVVDMHAVFPRTDADPQDPASYQFPLTDAYLQAIVDTGAYYNGDINPFGLFNRYGVPRKNYCAMDAFQRLLATPQRVQASGWQAGRTAACAGMDAEGRQAGVLISNLRSEESSFVLEIDHLPWNEPTAWTAYLLDAERNLERVASGVHAAGQVRLQQALPAPGVLLIQLRPASQEESTSATSSHDAAPVPTENSTSVLSSELGQPSDWWLREL